AKKNSLKNRKKQHQADLEREKKQTEKIEAKAQRKIQKRKHEEEKKKVIAYDEIEDEGLKRGRKKIRREVMEEDD
ncbi:hypothetical protein DICPUDRAFT_29882, partial [Dictyostelium purpureum]